MKKIIGTSLAILLLTLFVIVIAIYGLRNNKGFQDYMLGYFFNEEVESEGNLTISLGLDTLHLAFDDYTLRNVTNRIKRISFTKATFEIPYFEGRKNPFQWPVLETQSGYLDLADGYYPLENIQASRQSADKVTIDATINELPLKADLTREKFDLQLNSKLYLSGTWKRQSDAPITLGLKINDHSLKAEAYLEDDRRVKLFSGPDEAVTIAYTNEDNGPLMTLTSDKVTYEYWQQLPAMIGEVIALINQLQKEDEQALNEEKADQYYKIQIDEFYKSEVLVGNLHITIDDTKKHLLIDLKDTTLFEATPTQNLRFPRKAGIEETTSLNLQDFNYTKLLKAFGTQLSKEVQTAGRATLDFKATLNGINPDQWLKNADGTLSLQGGEASFDGRLLNLWAGGFINYLIPSFSSDKETEMKCFEIKADFADGIAQITPLVLNTERVLVFGRGEYDYVNRDINLVLKPESKGVAIGTIASDIRISGPVSNPNITPDAMSALKKLGTIALGSAMPAFYLFSLTDLGITKDNPC